MKPCQEIINKYGLYDLVLLKKSNEITFVFGCQDKTLGVKMFKLVDKDRIMQGSLETMHEDTEILHQYCDYVLHIEEIHITLNEIDVVFDLCDYNFRYFKTHSYSPSQFIQYVTQMLVLFSIAQCENILHRNIKPSNILFKNNQVKVADFSGSFGKLDVDLEPVGWEDSNYLPLEIIKYSDKLRANDREILSLSFLGFVKLDVFALGITLLEILLKLNKKGVHLLAKLRFQSEYSRFTSYIDRVSLGSYTKKMKLLLRYMLHQDPIIRPDFILCSKIMEIFYSADYQTIEKLLSSKLKKLLSSRIKPFFSYNYSHKFS
jgi:serine/threonine protein kinase